MSLGNKILELRKKKGLSQENLAEELGITRQTVSNWELNQTSPTIEQAKELSKFFNISLDELTNNDLKNVMVEKVSNTEKLAGLIIKILKIIGITILVLFILQIIGIALFMVVRNQESNTVTSFYETSCTLNEKKYVINIDSDSNYNCINCDNILKKEVKDQIDFNDIQVSSKLIEKYFINLGGNCE